MWRHGCNVNFPNGGVPLIMSECCDQRRGHCPHRGPDHGSFRTITSSSPCGVSSPVRRHLSPAGSSISHPVMFKLWIRITFSGTETPTTAPKTYYIGRFIYFIFSQKKPKTVSLLPVLLPSAQTAAGSGSIKTTLTPEGRRRCASDRERPSSSRILLSLTHSFRQIIQYVQRRTKTCSFA